MATTNGTSGDDVYRGTELADTINGFGGDDIALGKSGDDRLDGGAGDDIMVGDGGKDFLIGGAGDDALSGGTFSESTTQFSEDYAADQMYGDAGNDILLVGSGDYGFGGIGDDIVEILTEPSAITSLFVDGGAGDDLVTLLPYGFQAVVMMDGLNLAKPGFQLVGVEHLFIGSGGSNVLGSAASEEIVGGAGVDLIDGAGGADRLSGGAGADVITGGVGSDIIDGGAGIDTAVYLAPVRSYSFGANRSTVMGGPDGGDSLTGVERLQFVDGYITTETTATAAAVHRLYQTTLGRAPDAAGLAFWTSQIDSKGATLASVANGFIGSPEFTATYGALNDGAFVELMYANVLHRASDAPGRKTWLDLLSTGHSRSEVVLGFSQSQEHINNTADAIRQGVWVGDANAGVAARFYDTVFGRLPDSPGLASWTKALNSGVSLQVVANGFVASTEFKATYGALNDNQFVELMYQNVLHRPSDTDRQTWLDLLNSGGSRAQVVVGFSESAEHIRLTAPHIDDGVWVA